MNNNLSDQDRINYCLGNLLYTKGVFTLDLNRVHFENRVYLLDRHSVQPLINVKNKDLIQTKRNKAFKNYLNEMGHFLKEYYLKNQNESEMLNKQFLFLPGDIAHGKRKAPVLIKTRPLNNRGYNVLLPLNYYRHFGNIKLVEENDIPYKEKKNQIVWRGGSTGNMKRIPLIEKYCYSKFDDIVDVGFTYFDNNYIGTKNKGYLKNEMTIKEQLKYKFIISVEGNDVASNLKWIMSSNSVCLRPHSTIESFFMEGILRPYHHYIPIKKDFSDLIDQYQWCIQNESKCLKIIENCKEYIEFYKDYNRMKDISVKILEKYAKKTHFF